MSIEEVEIAAGFSLRMSPDHKTCNLQIRAPEVITTRVLIGMLRDLADQLEEDHKNDGEEKYN